MKRFLTPILLACAVAPVSVYPHPEECTEQQRVAQKLERRYGLVLATDTEQRVMDIEQTDQLPERPRDTDLDGCNETSCCMFTTAALFAFYFCR